VVLPAAGYARVLVRRRATRRAAMPPRSSALEPIPAQVILALSKPYGYFLCRGRQDTTCDLPHLPVKELERAVAREVRAL